MNDHGVGFSKRGRYGSGRNVRHAPLPIGPSFGIRVARIQNIQLHGLAQLKPGSVRVLANDTQVEDLVQTRLQALAHSLLGQPEVWREQSSFFKQPLAQRDTEVTDAASRDVVDPRQVVDARQLGDIEHG